MEMMKGFFFTMALMTAWASTAPADGPSTARLVSGAKTAAPGGSFAIGLHLTLAEGWHTYWINPGDAGMAPMLDWTLPPGVSVGEPEWPAPGIFPDPPLVSYGYENEVVLPLRVNVPADWPAGKPLTLAAKIRWLICKESCRPVTRDVELTVATAAALEAARNDDATLLARFVARVPQTVSGSAEARRGAEGLTLTVRDENPATGEPVFLPENGAWFENAWPQTWTRTADGWTTVLKPTSDFPKTNRFFGVWRPTESGMARRLEVLAPDTF